MSVCPREAPLMLIASGVYSYTVCFLELQAYLGLNWFEGEQSQHANTCVTLLKSTSSAAEVEQLFMKLL